VERRRVSQTETVQDVHRRAIVIDALGGYGFAYRDILTAGITATTVTLAMYGSQGLDFLLSEARRYYGLMEMDTDRVMLVQEADDILSAKRQGKLGIIFGLQSAVPLGQDVNLLPILYKLGLRVIQLTYNEANAFGCGCTERNDTGLTSLGVQLIQAMNRLGILVDLSHAGHRTALDAIQISDSPVAFTHANPSALKAAARNKPDELIRALTAKGGVVGLTPYAAFCKSEPGQRPTIRDFVDQVDYVVQLVGIEHVGIGTDKFEGKSKEEHWLDVYGRYPKLIGVPFEHRFVEGFDRITDFPRLTEALLMRGYSEADCLGILGGNFLSLFRQVWRKSRF
jgi:membrane dipeptidase